MLQEELELDSPFLDAKHEAVLNIVRTASVLTLAGGSLLRDLDLTEAQFNVLMLLKYKQAPLTQTDIGRRLVITRASVTSVLDRLEAKRLVKRVAVPGNRRIYHIEFTPKGAGLIEQAEPQYRQLVHRLMADLNDKKCRTLIGLLEQIRATATKAQSK